MDCLGEIGFYTLSDERVDKLCYNSPIARAEILLTDRCNLKCPYCRGLRKDIQGEMPLDQAKDYVYTLINNDTQNIRFSGGEPTLYQGLPELVWRCKRARMKHIAVSTNGTADLQTYKNLMALGVNDFSISLDAGCCAVGTQMVGGVTSAWDKASQAIEYLAHHTYVTVGVVFNELNYTSAVETLKHINSLNPSDIRIISSAQYNQALEFVSKLPPELYEKFPILRYRVRNFNEGLPIRGLRKTDSCDCFLVIDDLAIAGDYHFPCIIYLREQGDPIGKMDKDFRAKRIKWHKEHNIYKDDICRNNCLDVCVAHNNRARDSWGLRHAM